VDFGFHERIRAKVNTVPPAGGPRLALDGVAKRFQTRDRVITALEATTLAIADGEFVTLVGPSGCGKSTLLNIVSGLIPASDGSVRLDGHLLMGVNRRVGYITQQDNLFPWRTLRDNVALPLEIAGVGPKERRDKTDYWLSRVGLEGFGDAYPHELSGGMRQRGAIVRTLIYEPPVILMDEPFGPLDAQTRIILQDMLLSIWDSSRSTIIFVTHDLTEAIALADRVLLMTARPGRIVRSERVGIPRPRDIFRIHEDPEFRHLYNEIWNELRVQVQNANALKH
jgi:NitT/TauT family transport system ATP-binding protein